MHFSNDSELVDEQSEPYSSGRPSTGEFQGVHKLWRGERFSSCVELLCSEPFIRSGYAQAVRHGAGGGNLRVPVHCWPGGVLEFEPTVNHSRAAHGPCGGIRCTIKARIRRIEGRSQCDTQACVRGTDRATQLCAERKRVQHDRCAYKKSNSRNTRRHDFVAPLRW